MEQPFIQLIILPDHQYQLKELESLAEEFYRVDVLSRQYKAEFIELVQNNLYVHVDLSESTIEQMINQHIDPKSDFYVVHNGKNKIPKGFCRQLQESINERGMVMLVKSDDALLVNTCLSSALCHNGSQPIEEKIDIFLCNKGRECYMFDNYFDLFTKEDSTSG